jgi:hypothetical protein
MTSIDEALARACSAVPGLQKAALVLVPEGLVIGGAGAESVMELEPLARSVARLSSHAPSASVSGGSTFVEYAFVSEGELTVVRRGQQYPRPALVLSCSRESNLAFVLRASRAAALALEATLDPASWGG